MQIFEFHFNPKTNNDKLFDSFIYTPENVYEKQLGNLYMAGELNNSIGHNLKLLENLSFAIKKKYYSISFKNPNKALTESLKDANEFLAQEIKKDNVGWMGNLSFASLSIKDLNLNFTATGNLKILLIRGGQIVDLGKNINMQEIEPYPLKVFFNIVSGKLAYGDMILILTTEIFDFFSQKEVLEKLSQKNNIDKKDLKDIFPQSLFDKEKISGFCFLILMKQEEKKKADVFNLTKKEGTKEIISGTKKRFSLKNIYSPVFKLLPKPRRKDVPKTALINPLKKISLISHDSDIKNKIVLIIILLGILLFGFFLFKEVSQAKRERAQIPIDEIKEKYETGEKYLLFEDNKKAQEIFEVIVRETELSDNSQIISIRESAIEKLNGLNNLEIIENPEIIIKEIDFNPENMVIDYPNFYFTNPQSPDLYKFNIDQNKESVFKVNKNLTFISKSEESLLLFSKPNTIILFKDGLWKEETIKLPDNAEFSVFFSYALNLYFWNKNELVKYNYLSNFRWADSQSWIKLESNVKSAISDTSIWLLDEDNSLKRYYKGELKESIDFNLYPNVENITKIEIKPDFDYIYLLEPKNNRVIITDKNGEVIKQIQSKEFNDLKDFEISENGKTIYLLNDKKIYKISF